MKAKIFGVIFLFLFLSNNSIAQSDTLSTINSKNSFSNSLLLNFWNNPAYAGIEGNHNVNTQFNYSPFYQNGIVAYDFKFGKNRKNSFGFYLNHESQSYLQGYRDFEKSHLGLITYARNFVIRKQIQISIGVNAEFHQYTFNGRYIVRGDVIDTRSGFIYNTGESVSQSSTNIGFPNFNIGATVKFKKLFIQTFVNNLTSPGVGFLYPASTLKRLYNLDANYTFNLSSNLLLQPELYLTYSEDVKLNSLILSHFIYNQKFLAGIGYQGSSQTYIELGYLLGKIRILANCKLIQDIQRDYKFLFNQASLSMRLNF